MQYSTSVSGSDTTERVLSMCTFSFGGSAFISLLYLSLCIAAGEMNQFFCLQERQRQLESMGISLESSGIKVGDDKCYLVNLNADPALNELLVYYLKVRMWPGCLHQVKGRLLIASNFWLSLLLRVYLDFSCSKIGSAASYCWGFCSPFQFGFIVFLIDLLIANMGEVLSVCQLWDKFWLSRQDGNRIAFWAEHEGRASC